MGSALDKLVGEWEVEFGGKVIDWWTLRGREWRYMRLVVGGHGKTEMYRDGVLVMSTLEDLKRGSRAVQTPVS